jgi:hypothetical protein
MMIEHTTKGLISLAKDLNKHNIRWAIGGSLLLFFEGYDNSVADIDIIVHDDDYLLLLEMLKSYKYTYQSPNDKYLTKHFFSLFSEGVDVDIMIGFKVVKEDHIYEFPFHIEKEILLEDTTISLSSVDEWLTAYKAMNRIDKVLLIQANKKRN